MGGLRKLMPVTFWTFLIATTALAGVPFTAGFLSKDAILGGTLAFSMEHPRHVLLPIFGFTAAGLTAFYMFRLVYLTFFGTFRGGEEAAHRLHESPRVMTMPLVTLSTLSLFFFYAAPAFNPTTPEGGWFATLFPTPERAYSNHKEHQEHEEDAYVNANSNAEDHSALEHTEHTAHIWAMLISILVAGLGIWVATWAYHQRAGSSAIYRAFDPEKWRLRFGVVYRGMFRKWWMDEIYDATAIRGTLGLSRGLAWFDLKVIDGIVNGSAWVTRGYSFITGWFDNVVVDGLVNLTAWIVGFWGRLARLLQGGQVQRYILYTAAAVGVVVVMLIA